MLRSSRNGVTRSCSALTVFVLLLSACSEQDPTPTASLPVSTNVLSADLGDSVLTPGGWRPRSCVHQVPNGARISTSGLVTRPDGSTLQILRCSRNLRGKTGSVNVPSINGYLEYAAYSTYPATVFHELAATWHVPATPVGAYPDSAVFYAFPGLQNAHPYINQPVIQYRHHTGSGSYWTGAPWHCDTIGDCFEGTETRVYPGDSIVGTVTATDCGSVTCYWKIQLTDVTTAINSVMWVSDTDNYTMAYGGVIEVHGITSCDQYPSYGVFFTSILLKDSSGTQVTPPSEWGGGSVSGTPSCYADRATTSSTVNLWADPWPSVSISAAPDSMYWAYATGGVPAYTYYWEWCALDCGGDGPSVKRGPRPHTVLRGWNFQSTDQAIQWTMPGSFLRNTITDSRGNQATGYYNMP